MIIKKPLLFNALDSLIKDPEGTTELAIKLSREVEGNFGFKVNVDYILKHGTEALKPIINIGRSVFADTKMWNGGRTMSDFAKEMVDMGVDYFNIYALADKEIEKVIKVLEGSKTKLLLVTLLTHYDEAYCQQHFKRSLEETVCHFADIAIQYKAHGIVLPGTCLPITADYELEKCVPGVRPTWFKDNRHEQEITPFQAVAGGANIEVCGSPIFKSDDPVIALRKVIAEMETGV